MTPKPFWVPRPLLPDTQDSSLFMGLPHPTADLLALTQDKNPLALAGGAQLVGMLSCSQKVAALTPSQDTEAGCGFEPRYGRGHIQSLV